jgi:hypothetical protein
MDDVLKAGRANVKFHVLYSVSAIIGNVNKQPSAIVPPSLTLKAAQNPAEVLTLAASCVENALQSALGVAQSGGKVFSPPNWLKSNASVQGETLVAGTIAGMLPSFPNGKTIVELLKAPPESFGQRWSAE